MHNFFILCLLSLVTANISFLISESALFRSIRRTTTNIPFLGEMICCGYCIGHWIAFGLEAIYKVRVFYVWWPLDYFLAAVIIAWLSGFQWVLMCLLVDKANK